MNFIYYIGIFVFKLPNKLTLTFEDNSRFIRRVLFLYKRSTIIGSFFNKIIDFVALDNLKIYIYVAGNFTGVIFI